MSKNGKITLFSGLFSHCYSSASFEFDTSRTANKLTIDTFSLRLLFSFVISLVGIWRWHLASARVLYDRVDLTS